MARVRAATSVSFTIGIAFATLLIGGGILAGPAILDCSRQPQNLGACLRGKVVDGGFLPPEPVAPKLISSEETAPRSPGWIEANATEYETLPPVVAKLSAEPGQLDAEGSLPSVEIGAQIALADPGVKVDAEGLVPLAAPSAKAKLAPIATGSIDATGGGEAVAGLAGSTSIEPPPVPAPPQVTGRVGTAHAGQGRVWLAPQLVADLSPVPPLDHIVEPVVPKSPPRLTPRPPLPPKVTAQARPKPAAPPRPPKYDPRYPSVLVLPPPNTGENSSFATLEVR